MKLKELNQVIKLNISLIYIYIYIYALFSTETFAERYIQDKIYHQDIFIPPVGGREKTPTVSLRLV